MNSITTAPHAGVRFENRPAIFGGTDSETTNYLWNGMHMQRSNVAVLHETGLVVALKADIQPAPTPDDLDFREADRARAQMSDEHGDVGACAMYQRFTRFYNDHLPFRVFLEVDRDLRVFHIQFTQPDKQ
jgi:hypothetical protein